MQQCSLSCLSFCGYCCNGSNRKMANFVCAIAKRHVPQLFSGVGSSRTPAGHRLCDALKPLCLLLLSLAAGCCLSARQLMLLLAAIHV